MDTLLFDISKLNSNFKTWDPRQILSWAWQTFKHQLLASSSFQTQSIPLLHMISEICPAVRIIFLDTGYHFQETLFFRDELTKLLHLRVVTIKADMDNLPDKKKPANALYDVNPDLCCYLHKVKPLQKALTEMGAHAWATGIRHDQTVYRKTCATIEPGPRDVVKINPLIRWSSADIHNYCKAYKLPAHPLTEKGYKSIGCAPCTRPVKNNEHERNGRWSESKKIECGLHTADYSLYAANQDGK
jgi:phosphoadenosine phosphosulfate reductase